MATFVNLGYPVWDDGMNWTSLLQRQLDGGVSIWDSNASLTAVSPLGGVFPGPDGPLQVAQQASPNMSVLVNAGYVAVPHPTAGDGVYLFGLQDQSTLTIAANGTASVRYDLIVARVYDEGNADSYCDIEVVEGTAGDGQPATPSASLLLAVVEVPSEATSITSGDITDKRTYTVAPGGILPSTTSAAPPLAGGQVLWNTSLSLLQRLASPITYSQTWTIPGTYSWVVPDDTTSYTPSATASGGGGGPGSTVGSPGGGGAEWAGEPPQANPVAGHTATIVVGAGGASAASSSDSAGAGEVSSFSLDDLTVTANPGQPGTDSPGLGGTGSTNTYHFDGGAGGDGVTGLNAGGGGGGSGGPGAPGFPGGTGNPEGPGGYGAPAVPGGGPGGQGGYHAGPGYAPATGPGGGGGGPGGQTNADGDPNPSGAGSDGQVTVTWTVQPAALTPVFSTDSGEDDLSVVDTSTGEAGSSGITQGSGSAYGWGIGYGSTTYSGFGFFGGGSGFDADGSVVPQIQVEFDADGATDFQIDAKWGIAVPEAAVDSASPSIAKGQCRIIIMLDGTILDTVYLSCSASGGVTHPGDGGCFTYYTSGQNGTTPGSGTHTATLAVETMSTLSGELSGAHVGNLASVGTSSYPFGGALPSWFTSSLVAENCSLRVAGILAASV